MPKPNAKPMKSIEQYLHSLKLWFEKQDGIVIAFSAGVDSSLVAFLAKHFLTKDSCVAIMSASASLKRSDLEEGINFCKSNDIPLRLIETKEMEDERYSQNPINRCYYCKSNLYEDLSDIAKEYPAWLIVNGQNLDDLGDYRPGMIAANENKVYSPLMDCKIDKNAVRELAQYFELECWDKPASPCLSSRIPYGEAVTLEKLKRIEAAEEYLKKMGFSDFRVRHLKKLARIEVPIAQIAELTEKLSDFKSYFIKLGFEDVELDPEGLVSGKLNRVIAEDDANKLKKSY